MLGEPGERDVTRTGMRHLPESCKVSTTQQCVLQKVFKESSKTRDKKASKSEKGVQKSGRPWAEEVHASATCFSHGPVSI